MAFEPYKQDEFVFVPQQLGHFMEPKLPGIWTFCFHPNTMTDEQIQMFADFYLSMLTDSRRLQICT